MDELNQVHRQLVWVKLGEQAEILGFSPRLDLQTGEGGTAPLAPATTEAIPAS